MTAKSYFLVLALCVGITASADAQQVHYVRTGASGSGTSWADAFGSLQDALAAAGAGDQVWVAAGTYRPDQGSGLVPGDRSLSFVIKAGVRLHGGFSGTESALGGRDLAVNRTVLSGDLSSDDYTLSLHVENSLHVVRFAVGADDALLEGVTVAGGNADGAGADSLGGGILVQGGAPWIANAHVNGSLAGCGGGIAVTGGSDATLVNVAVHGNRAGSGGGVCSLASSLTVTGATVTANWAVVGPGILNRDGDASIANSIVSGNRRLDDLDHCDAWQYPCSLADVPEEALAKGLEVIQGAWSARDAGTMADALAYLESHPDVVQALGDSSLVMARVRGGTFDVLAEAPEGVGTAGKRDPVPGSEADRPPFLASSEAGARFATSAHRSIVGEDLDGDGRIDNRDGKRALVIAPFNTLDAAAVALALDATLDYRGRVEIASGDTLPHYTSWDEYDFVYLSTRATAMKDSSLSLDFITVIETAIPLNMGSGNILLCPDCSGLFRGWSYKETGILPNYENMRAALTPHFFRKTYDGSLDNAVIVCAGCDVQTGRWSQTLGTDNFSLLGWSGPVEMADAGPKAAGVVAIMATGLEADDARHSGGIPVISSDQFFWADHFSQLGRRIIDLPLLLYPGTSTVLRDGMDITKAVVGTVGDDVADSLAVDLVMQGVRESQIQFDSSGFWVHYVVKDVDNGYEYSLGGAVPLGVNAYLVQHRIPLGFPVQKGLLPIEVVAKVPVIGLETSESRFSVNATVDAFPCSATATVSGFRDAAFTGPAGIFYSEDPQGLRLDMESLEWTIGLDPDGDGIIRHAYSASVLIPIFLGTGTYDIPNDTYSLVQSYDLSDAWGFLTAHYTDTCAECGGKVTIDSLNTDGTLVYGSIELTGMEGTFESPDVSTLKASFKAAMEDYAGEEDPYTQCVEAYYQLD